MRIGYARVSTDEQNLNLQRSALEAAGCDEIFVDLGVSGAAQVRPGLGRALEAAGQGDVLVVWKLDRLGRSLAHLVTLLGELDRRQIGFASLTESIDTTTPGGRLIFHVMAALAEFERALVVERTRAGMKAARRRGRHVGRPQKLTAAHLDHARALLASGTHTRRSVAALLGVDESTLRRRMGGCAGG